MTLFEFFPCTIYAASVVYVGRLNPARVVVLNVLGRVSGTDPLTEDEQRARAKRDAEAAWSEEKNGPLYRFEHAFTVLGKLNFTTTVT